ncbi:Ectoine hydroxylase-related dioxygenase, phytanoyl-CoA dioxygenase (PhyH) family [Andreprevotia lacus DSM 23236]|jgi:ectoine hydroxylase-related dioxygenase (phytanoyl-CoA dioxygenase family)|uniref:Ectoine hydroxylase-related dioxygenase, phytanoyl-CoA dioxygenase (PhyH) family n=1 Tax=Andreprevotia lacus DSM 23236 TaxID=1121001 RepID=A0A1W1WXG3_9NEIS|nr:phytanoyl-CoA dioxygenase family protein [Andreprevotia lacus]SMC16436.1 Ectoine hydroxylase-related dioxygenase, phytanoyl-CoA dioxygenase (PhyH) family [Andreprevotia lacus DSM 23236]
MNDRYQYGNARPGNPSVAYTEQEQLRQLHKQLPLRVLSEADFAHWQRYGYVIIKDAISPEQVQRTADFLWEFQQLDPHDPASWSRPQLRDHEMKELNGSGMVEAYQNQRLWDNRQQQRIYDAFVDIWDRTDLWVTIDRANLNPPNQGQRRFGGFIHWDADTSLTPLPVNVQGVLALSDTTEAGGGFQCIPELFENLEAWRASAPADRNPWQPDLANVPWQPRFIPMKAGELLIFNSLLAHGIRPNTSTDKVRLAQYISFSPADEANTELRERRIGSWYKREPAHGYAFPGDPRDWEQTRYPRAQLSPLGERILGLRNWVDGQPAFDPATRFSC